MGSFARKRLGDVLVEAGAITEGQLQEAMTEQVSSQKRISQVLIEKHFITEEQMVEILEEKLGIPHVNLYNYNVNPDVATSIPLYLARRHLVIPIDRQENKLRLAMADPMNIIAIDDVAMVTGLEVIPVVASESAVIHAIEQLFSLVESIESEAIGGRIKVDDDEIAQLKALVEDAPIVKVVNSLIHQAVTEEASDIHIEPSGKGVRVRMRIDGILHDLMTPPKDTQPLIVSRIKIMANLDIAEKRIPQDGRITIQVGLKDVNMRVSTMPTIHGEKVVIRILDKERVVLTLDKLGFSDENYKIFTNFLMNSSGMILSTGPTGSGKTTTLYSALNYLNKAEDNIITVEDPVEFRLDGINQVQVNPRINLGFANALRTILRQDPNVIMIGEIRDIETAEMATRAALTGHLVLSTLHTNDACSTITRLLDMGVDHYLITSSLLGVVAQRLIRLNCTHCREQFRLTAQEHALFVTTFGTEPPETIYKGRGCRHCNNTGYRGRMAIHEMLVLNRDMHRLILERASKDRLQEKALENGMLTLLQDGLRRIVSGDSTLEEVVRVAYSGSGSEELAGTATARTLPPPVSPSAVGSKAPESATTAAGQPSILPEVRIECSGPAMLCHGETGTLRLAVINSGSVPLTNTAVTVSLPGGDQRRPIGGLAVGQQVDYTVDFSAGDIAAETIDCAAVVTAEYGSESVESQTVHTVQVARPALNIEKNGPPSAQPGETIDYQFVVINTGNVPLEDVTVKDPLLGDDWNYTIGQLPPGGMSNFSMELTVPEELSGRVEEKAVAAARYLALAVNAEDSFGIDIIGSARPALSLEISGPETARVGDTVTYRFMISNTGAAPLSGVKVTAPLFGKFWCNTIGNLAAEKSVKFSFSYTIPEGTSSNLVNTVSVSGRSGADEVTGKAEHYLAIAP